MEQTDCIQMLSGKKKGTICLQNCIFPVVRDVAKSMGIEEMKFTDQWDVCWCDSSIDIKKAKSLKKFQRINHFLGMSEICRKDSLSRNLNTMMNNFPDDYNFFPKTWNLPSDYLKLQIYKNKHKNSTYILKPSSGSRGTGIYLTKSLKKINQYENMICQLYITKPFLIDDYKFDIRVYTLISSCDPLKIYVYNDGLVRLATEPYEKPTNENFRNPYMHLTNYSVNKRSKSYVDNETYGSKRRITTLNDQLANKGCDVKKLWKEIDDIIIKTVILSYPFVNRTYQICFSGHKYTSACFEILGFDILLDENCKPLLLEVNHSPDFHTSTALDKIIKRELLEDTFKLLQLHKSFKKIVSGEEKWKIEQQIKHADKSVYKERILAYKETYSQQNNEWESKNMGNYRLVFSEENKSLYEHFFYLNESTLYQNTQSSSNHHEPEKPLQKKPETRLSKRKQVVSSTPEMVRSDPVKQKTSTDHTKNHIGTKAVPLTTSVPKIKQVSVEEKRVVKKFKSPRMELNKLLVNNIQNTLNIIHACNKSNRSSNRRKTEFDKQSSHRVEYTHKIVKAVESNSREEIDIIKKKNKEKFPGVQSCLYSKHFVKKQCFWEGWKETFIDECEENDRLNSMYDRAELVFNLDVKKYIYDEFEKFDNLYDIDHVEYAEHQRRKYCLGIKPLTYHIVNVTYDNDGGTLIERKLRKI